MIPNDIKHGTKFYYVFPDGLSIKEWYFDRWLGKQMVYVVEKLGHQVDRQRCFLTRADAVKHAVKILKDKIAELESRI